jgi:enoyl-CoA hydratase
MAEAEIRFERRRALGIVTLDRQSTLNALTRSMVQALSLQLAEWREEPEVAAVIIKAAPGRAFCAGGDIRDIYAACLAGKFEEAAEFYREEYRLNWRIFRYPKPCIALIDGIVMGGGAGISVHGSHRVVSENVLFAMPETGIGFFPDVGASYFLPRAPGAIGMYMGLCGTRLEAADCLDAEIATHHVVGDDHARLEEALLVLEPGAGSEEVDALVDPFTRPAGPSMLDHWRDAIDECFGQPTLLGIVEALGRETEGFGQGALEMLREKSPLSLHVTFAQLHKGGACRTFEEAMALEFRLARRFLHTHDLREGIRAQLIEKDRRPKWESPTIETVPDEAVDAFFAGLEDDELALDWQGL